MQTICKSIKNEMPDVRDIENKRRKDTDRLMHSMCTRLYFCLHAWQQTQRYCLALRRFSWLDYVALCRLMKTDLWISANNMHTECVPRLTPVVLTTTQTHTHSIIFMSNTDVTNFKIQWFFLMDFVKISVHLGCRQQDEHERKDILYTSNNWKPIYPLLHHTYWTQRLQ